MAKENKVEAGIPIHEFLQEPNKEDFWDYCREVTKAIDNRRRWVLDDMDAVRVSFDQKWTPRECAETIMERRESLKLI